MKTRLGIAALVFMMVQPVLFGIGVTAVLATPLAGQAMQLMPWVIGTAFAIAVPLSWWLAPRLRARYWRRLERPGRADKVLDAVS